MSAQDPTENAYQIAAVIAGRAERALEKAIDYYFKSTIWNESILQDRGGICVYDNGNQVFFIDDVELVRFGPTEMKVEINGNAVCCTFHQEITDLYHE